MKQLKTLMWGIIFSIIYLLTPTILILITRIQNTGSDAGSIAVILLFFVTGLFINWTLIDRFKLTRELVLESTLISILFLIIELVLCQFIYNVLMQSENYLYILLVVLFLIYIPYSFINIIFGFKIGRR